MKSKLLSLLLWGSSRSPLRAANIAEGVHEGAITRKVDAALSVENLLVKRGSDDDHVAVCGASDCPQGTVSDTPSEAEEYVGVNLLGCAKSTLKMVAVGAVTAGPLFTAAGGKVQNLPSAPGTYYQVGNGLHAAAAAAEVEVDPCCPIKTVVT